MQIRHNVALKDYSTMRLGGVAKHFVTVTSNDELVEAIEWAEKQHVPLLVLGGGSNVIFSNGFDGLVMLNRLEGFEVTKAGSGYATIRIGAGEDWDGAVEKTTAMGLTGVEALSAIPGTAGATPVQNVGAYGQEIADTFVELEAYDMQEHKFVTLTKDQCGFSYRFSIFKSPKDRRYVITSLTLRLAKNNPRPPFYESLQRYLSEHNITTYTPSSIREAVIAIRARRLPDPRIIANTGSFFKNPIIEPEKFATIVSRHPDIPHWRVKDGHIKLSAGWLIEHTGLKGYRNHGMKIYEENALVFVNEGAQEYSDLAAFREEVIDKVQRAFGVTLEQEPELL